jgi:hypothetical protein
MNPSPIDEGFVASRLDKPDNVSFCCDQEIWLTQPARSVAVGFLRCDVFANSAVSLGDLLFLVVPCWANQCQEFSLINVQDMLKLALIKTIVKIN